MKHKVKKDIKLGENELFGDGINEDAKCPNCGGILITSYGAGISCTFCADCDYNDYDYE